MENASKAILMAAGILIALLILGALILMFTRLGMFQSQNDAQTKQSQIAAFNNQFEPYNGKNLTLMDLKSLYSKIVSNNKKDSSYRISINNADTDAGIENEIQTILSNKMNQSPPGASEPTVDQNIDYFIGDNFKKILNKYKMWKVFAICTGMDYNGENSRIRNVNIGI